MNNKKVIKIKESKLKELFLQYTEKALHEKFGNDLTKIKPAIEALKKHINEISFEIESDIP